MKKSLDRIKNSANYFITYIFLLIVILLFIYNMLFITTISYNFSETVSINVLNPLNIIINCILLFFILKKINYNFLNNVKEKYLFIIFSLISFVVGMIMILNVGGNMLADALEVYNHAKKFLIGDFSGLLSGEYLNFHPHQLGLTLYEMIILRFFPYASMLNLINLIQVIGINFIMYKISDEILNNRIVNNLTIIMTFLFVPQLIFIMFPYGIIPGFFFLTISFYLTIKYLKSHRLSYLVLISFFSFLSIAIKSNFMIGVIAIIIILLLDCLNSFKIGRFLGVLLIVITLLFTNIIVKGIVESISKTEINKGVPKLLYVVMGTDIDNVERGPGWYNAINADVYISSGYDYEKSNAVGKELLSNNIDKIISNPLRSLKFFNEKIISTWTDPLYESVWSGPFIRLDLTDKNKLVQVIYSDNKIMDFVSYVLKFENCLILLASLLFITKNKKRENVKLVQVLYLYLIGGFLFHLIWETKSQYVYQYIFCLIPICAYQLNDFFNKR